VSTPIGIPGAKRGTVTAMAISVAAARRTGEFLFSEVSTVREPWSIGLVGNVRARQFRPLPWFSLGDEWVRD
jgi:hypothetical protein